MYTRMRRNTTSFTANQGNKRITLIVITALLAVAVVILSVAYARSAVYQNKAEAQFKRQITSAVVDAIENVNRLTGGVQSDSSAKLALVRQNIYLMDRLNAISVSLSGDQGILVPQEALNALYEDLSVYEKLLQTATSSTLDIRTTLLTHLTALNELLRQ